VQLLAERPSLRGASSVPRCSASLSRFQESYDAVHLGPDGVVRHRPLEISHRLDQVMVHLRDHYDPAWSLWARDDLLSYFPDSSFPVGDTDEPSIEAGWSAVPASSRSTSLSQRTTPDISLPSQSSRGRKRTTVSRPSPPLEAAAASPSPKRSRSQTGSEDVRAPLDDFDPYTIPSPFPRALFPDNIRALHDSKQEGRWIAAAKQAGLLDHPVSLLTLPLDAVLIWVFSVADAKVSKRTCCASPTLPTTVDASSVPILAKAVAVSHPLTRLLKSPRPRPPFHYRRRLPPVASPLHRPRPRRRPCLPFVSLARRLVVHLHLVL
jgi:hypothetical protein